MNIDDLDLDELTGVFADYARAVQRYRIAYGGDPDLSDLTDLTLFLPIFGEVVAEGIGDDLAAMLRERAERLRDA